MAGGWPIYHEVNEKFARAAASVCGRGDVVWIHDYHLMLLPSLLMSAP